jgi:hypothetical protein
LRRWGRTSREVARLGIPRVIEGRRCLSYG